MNNPIKTNSLFLFPLNTVVFVNGTLYLKIFEQRYLNLVKSCMKHQHGFATVLIRKGKEVNDTPETHDIGTYVDIIDWNALDNHMLGITIQGYQRVRINETRINDDNLMSADIEYLDNLETEKSYTVDEELLKLLQALHQHPFVSARYPEINFNSAVEIAYKLCELLPISNIEKQKLLEINDTPLLIDHLKTAIEKLENLSAGDDFL